MKILVPAEVKYSVPLSEDPNVTLALYAQDEPIPAEHCDAVGIITKSQSGEVMKGQGQQLPNLRWVQTSSAGPDKALSADFAPEVVISTAQGLHNGAVAEHAITLLLASMRGIGGHIQNTASHTWDKKAGIALGSRGVVSTLVDARVTIWGFGSIGKHLATILKAMGAEVTGVATTAGERDGFRVVAASEVDSILPETDVLIALLPGVDATKNIIDESKLAKLPQGAWFINCGRGNTVDQDALIAALKSGALAGAGVDVVNPEPLPEDSTLWDAPNIIITPHQASAFRDDGAAFFASQVAAFVAGGSDLINVYAR